MLTRPQNHDIHLCRSFPSNPFGMLVVQHLHHPLSRPWPRGSNNSTAPCHAKPVDKAVTCSQNPRPDLPVSIDRAVRKSDPRPGNPCSRFDVATSGRLTAAIASQSGSPDSSMARAPSFDVLAAGTDQAWGPVAIRHGVACSCNCCCSASLRRNHGLPLLLFFGAEV